MATELFKLLALKGHEPAAQVLMPFGGAGPMQATLLATEAGLAGVAVPPAAATFCALGAAMADVRRDFVSALGHARLAQVPDRLWSNWRILEKEAAGWLAGEGIATLSQDLEYAADMRYAGQAHNLMVAIPASAPRDRNIEQVAEAFHAAHEAIYGFRESDEAIEIVSQRISIIGRVPEVALPKASIAEDTRSLTKTRKVFYQGTWIDVDVRRREHLVPGARIEGPLIVEQDDTTVWVLPGWHMTADDLGVLHIQRSR
jgi:N-methylhydantoinase A